jgi:hypothetical protein
MLILSLVVVKNGPEYPGWYCLLVLLPNPRVKTHGWIKLIG